MPHTAVSSSFTLRLLLLLLIATLVAWPLAEPFLLQTEYVTLSSSAELSGAAQPLRIVFLSDIHAGPYFSQARVESLAARINALQPDLVLLGGDYADTSSGAIAFFQQLPPLQARYAVCAVAGNHDRTAPESNLALLTDAMHASGVVPLINGTLRIDTHAGRICIAGIDDIDNGWPQLAQVAGSVSGDEYVIFLCHSPAIMADAAMHPPWYDLALFGHTHGGQIAPLARLLAPEGLPEAFCSGWTDVHGTPHLTSRGVGTTFLPLRFLCLPQLHVIDIVPQ